MPTDKKRKMGARDGRVTKEPTTFESLVKFGAKAIGLLNPGNMAPLNTANEPLKKIAPFVKKRKKRQQQRQRNR